MTIIRVGPYCCPSSFGQGRVDLTKGSSGVAAVGAPLISETTQKGSHDLTPAAREVSIV